MSLELLLGPSLVEQLMSTWPKRPVMSPLPHAGRELSRLITADTVNEILDHGCFPAADINIVKNDAVRHPRLFTTADRLDAAKLQRWRDRGYTVQMRHLERWLPPMATMIRSIQRQTACPSYVSAFVTPAGHQGLGHHWDQYLSIVVQLAGTKTWDLWEPMISDPTRDYQTTVQLWQDTWVTQWAENGPDLSFDLTKGHVLILPRGWIHNPYTKNADEPSIHLTFVIKERTPLWIAEQLTVTAIGDAAFRQAIPPNALTTDTLAARIEHTRTMLIEHLSALDLGAFVGVLRHIADTEQDLDLI
jgi:ribosomal protein L16 Arg81 hydroxylase